LKTYKYILELHCVENGKFNNSSTFTYLYKFEQPKKVLKNATIFFKSTWMHIRWLINIIVIELKIILMLIIKLKKYFYF